MVSPCKTEAPGVPVARPSAQGRLPRCPRSPADSRLLEAPHTVQDVELLPPFGEVHFAIDVVRVPQVDKGQVLQDQTPGDMWRSHHCARDWLGEQLVGCEQAAPPGRASEGRTAPAVPAAAKPGHTKGQVWGVRFLLPCELWTYDHLWDPQKLAQVLRSPSMVLSRTVEHCQ